MAKSEDLPQSAKRLPSELSGNCSPVRLPSVHHPFLAPQSAGFVCDIHDDAASETRWVWTHKTEVAPILEIMSIELSTHDIQNTIWNN